MRLTDAADGADCRNQYSYWPSFNVNNTRLFVTCAYQNPGETWTTTDVLLYGFDPAGFRVTSKKKLSLWSSGIGSLGVEDAIWSNTQPDILFGHNGSQIWAINVATDQWTLVKDFGSTFSGVSMSQMTMSNDDQSFAFSLRSQGSPDWGVHSCAVYNRAQDKVVANINVNHDEVHIDKTGRYLMVNALTGNPGGVQDQVYDLSNGMRYDLQDGPPDYAPDHADYGAGNVAAAENWGPSITFRQLGNPHSHVRILNPIPLGTGGNDWSQSQHLSMLADDENWVLVSFYLSNGLPSSGIFKNELVQVATDGSQRVRRLVHHQSVFGSYWDSPRANISKDGRYIVFTSNWGGTSRHDAFVLRVPGGSSTPQPLAVATLNLGGGTVGTAYSQGLSASGGVPPYTFYVSAGVLPSGLNLASDGQINGVPSSAGSYSFTAQVRDSSGATATRALTISIAAPQPTLAITTSALPGGTAGTSYSQQIAETGGTDPCTWSVTGAPAGMSINSSTGVFAGTPQSAGAYSVTFTIRDAASASASRTLTLSVAAQVSPLAISTASLSGGTVGTPYSQAITGSGGVPPYSFSVSGGALPAGLSLSAGGQISGVPSTSGSYSFTAQVRDSAGTTATKALSISIAPAQPTLAITTSALPGGTVGSSYSQQIAETGGTDPCTWSATGAPAGLSINSSTGVFAGTPQSAGTFNVTFTIRDSKPATANRTLTLTVAATVSPLTITTTSLGGGTVGTAYSGAVAASGGTKPYTFSIRSGVLPGGLALDASSGAIAGTPTSAGSFRFSIRVSDGVRTASRTFTITVAAAPAPPAGKLTITPASGPLPGASIGSYYYQQLRASGDNWPYTYRVIAGSLPPGITLWDSTGELQGGPNTTGTFSFTVEVKDGAGATGTAAYSITVN
jgi:hypothetical protein